MISVTEAKQIIKDHCKVPEPVNISLPGATGKILANDIVSEFDIPSFPQSSMDGYAFNYDGFIQHKNLHIIGEIAAGDNKHPLIKPNEAIRIFTGAPVPYGADTVVMQEKTIIENGTLIIDDNNIRAGSNVRNKGSEIKAGNIAMEAGSILTAAAIGFLAGIGITEVMIYPSPSVAIIVTGNELQTPGSALEYGQVYESNSFALKAALSTMSIDNINIKHVKDNLPDITTALQNTITTSDIVLLTGGVSVGDYDFVVKAAEACGIEKLFHKVKQKPGKPLYVGKKENKMIFGLPGNPSSVLTCFYQYVVLALQILQNNPAIIKTEMAELASPVTKAAGLTHFLKGSVSGTKASVLNAQESYRMQSFAKANCLIEIEEHVTNLNEADKVKIYLLPGC
ncbi:MAG: molybdopterin molybdotransferase MoeA [Ferruginibacter sp.]